MGVSFQQTKILQDRGNLRRLQDENWNHNLMMVGFNQNRGKLKQNTTILTRSRLLYLWVFRMLERSLGQKLGF